MEIALPFDVIVGVIDYLELSHVGLPYSRWNFSRSPRSFLMCRNRSQNGPNRTRLLRRANGERRASG